MNKILEKIDQAMPPGGVLDVTLENIQNIASALIAARECIVTQSHQMTFLEMQIREILIRKRDQYERRECND